MSQPISIFTAAAKLQKPDQASDFLTALLQGLGHDTGATASTISSVLEKEGVGWCDGYLHLYFPLIHRIIPSPPSAVSVSRALAKHGWIKIDKDGKCAISTRWNGRPQRMMTIPYLVEGSALQWKPVGAPLEFMAKVLIQKLGLQFFSVAMNTTTPEVLIWMTHGNASKRLDAKRLVALYDASMQIPSS